MALSTDVRLARRVAPEFPDRCVGCGEEAPGRTERVVRRTSSWVAFLTLWIGRRHAVDVPCCEPCAARLRSVRRRRTAWMIAITIGALALIMPSLEHLEGPVRRVAAMSLILLALAPTIVVEVLTPPAFDMYVRRDTVDYEFRDAVYAHEFHRLNEASGAVLDD